MIFRRLRDIPKPVSRWLMCAGLTAIIGAGMSLAGLPAAWLIAGVIAAAICALAQRSPLTPHPYALRPAQGVIGVIAAAPMATLTLREIHSYSLAAVVCSLATLILCLICAAVLARAARSVSGPTAVLSTLAGGASGISTMAHELNVDARYVSLSQYLRLVVVTLTLPLILAVTTAPPHSSITTPPSDLQARVLGATVVVLMVFGVGYLGQRLHIPAPFLLTPLALTLMVALVFGERLDLHTPSAVANLAYVLIGWQAGGGLTRASLAMFVRLIPLTMLFIATMIAGCALLALWIAELLDIPYQVAYLATSPGGIYAVLAAAQQSGAGPAVTALQVIRLLVMVATAVVVGRAFSRVARVESSPGPSTTRTNTVDETAPTRRAEPVMQYTKEL